MEEFSKLIESIKSLLSCMYSQLPLGTKNNLNDKNVFCENLMRDILNMLYGYHLVNANTHTGKPNVPGIDLIDEDKKVAVQVSSRTDLKKMREMIQVVDSLDYLKGYHIRYVALTNDASNLKNCNINSVKNFVFTAASDVIDGVSLITSLMDMNVFDLRKLDSHLKDWLGLEVYDPLAIAKYVNPEKRLKVLKSDDKYILRKFTCSLAIEKEDANINRWLHPEIYPKGVLEDFVTGNIVGITTNHFIIYSSAQSGKTTELLHLKHILSEKNKFIPLLINAKEYVKHDKGCFLHILPYRSENEVVLMIDGLDEIPDSFRPKLYAEIHQFIDKYPHTKVLLTCRQNFQDKGDLKEFTRLFLNELTFEDVKSYIKQTMVDSSDLLMEIMDKELYKFICIPFYLKALVEYYNECHKLPSRRMELYQYWVDKSFKLSDEEGRISKTKYEANNLLRMFALVMQLTELQELTIDEIINEMGYNQEDLDKCLHYVIFHRNGDKCLFTHNAFKEYYVAQYLLQRSVDEILSLVCYDKSKVKKSWYNVLMLALSMMENENNKFNVLLKWVLDNDIEILLYIDPLLLTDDVKLRILKEVLLNYKIKGIYPEEHYSTYFALAHLCTTRDTAQFLLEELKSTTELGPYLAMIEYVLESVDFDSLRIMKLDKEFEDAMFNKIAELGNTNDQLTYCLYATFDNKHFKQKNFIDRLMAIDVSSLDRQRIVTLVELIAETGLGDDYIDFLIAHEREVDNFHFKGASHLVHRDCVYKAFLNIKTYEGITKTWKHLRNLAKNNHYRVEEDLNKVIHHLLSESRKLVVNHPDLALTIENIWFAEYYHGGLTGKCSNELFNAYRDFMLQTKQTKDIVEWRDEIRQKMNMGTLKNGELYYFQCHLGLVAKMDDAERLFDDLNGNDQSDYILSSWFITSMMDDWDQKVKNLIKERFPTFEQNSQQSWEERIDEERKLLFDYKQFKAVIWGIINRYKPENPKDLRQKIKDNETDQWNNYVFRFFFHSYDCNNETYDLAEVKTFVEDKEYYEMFLLKEIMELSSASRLTSEQIFAIKDYLNEYLCAEVENPDFERSMLSLAMTLDIQLDEVVIKKHIFKAGCRDRKKRWDFRGGYFIEYAAEILGKNVVAEAVIKFLNPPYNALAIDYFKLAEFALNERLILTYPNILELMNNEDMHYKYQLAEIFVQMGSRGEQYLKNIFDSANEDLKISIISLLYRQSKHHIWLKDKLLRYRNLFNDNNQKLILRFLLGLGEKDALAECLTLMKKNPNTFTNSEVPTLNYSDIKYLPRLKQLMTIGMNIKSEMNAWPSRIIDALSQIAICSETNMLTICKYLEGLAKQKKEYRYLNRSVHNIRCSYYERNTKAITIAEAMTFVGIKS